MKRLNSSDIARLAGVSRSTVSRVVNGYSNVPPETHERVMRVIREHNYYPLLSGQLLAGKKTRTLGLFWAYTGDVPDDDATGKIASDFMTSSFFVYITEAAAARGYMVLSSIIRDIRERRSEQLVKRTFMQERIDGGVFIGASNHEPVIEELIEAGKVVGLFDHWKDGDWEPNRIAVNFERETGERCIDYVVGRGHREIAIIDGDMNRYSSYQRHEGYIRGMQRHNLAIRRQWMRYGGLTADDGERAAAQLLDDCRGDYPTVICANNDAVAFGVYQALEARGLRVPEDISVIGIDGHQAGQYLSPPLTTFAFDFQAMFSSLVDRTIATIEGREDEAPYEHLPSQLVERGSVRTL